MLTFIEAAPGASLTEFGLAALALIGILAVGMALVEAMVQTPEDDER